MIIHTIGLEGCGHHGLEPIFEHAVQKYGSYHGRGELQQICKLCCDNKSYDLFEEKCKDFFKIKREGVYYIDNSYPSGFNDRSLKNQWKISKLYDILNKHQDVKLIHLKRNIFNTVNSHPNWDGGIIGHSKKLNEVNNFINSELCILKSRGVEITEIFYENIEKAEVVKAIASLLSVDCSLIDESIKKTFVFSKKDYRKILDNETINEIRLIFNIT
jgi:hypothetical protein